jgi:hypothetical protein
MKLTGRACLVRPTTLGVRVLKDAISITEGGSFEALVEEEDERGIWLNPREDEVGGRTLLVKWEYVATIEIVKEATSG